MEDWRIVNEAAYPKAAIDMIRVGSIARRSECRRDGRPYRRGHRRTLVLYTVGLRISLLGNGSIELKPELSLGVIQGALTRPFTVTLSV